MKRRYPGNEEAFEGRRGRLPVGDEDDSDYPYDDMDDQDEKSALDDFEEGYHDLMEEDVELPTPSEDEGDLRPNRATPDVTSDWLVAREEGLPYDAPSAPEPNQHFDEPDSLSGEGVAISASQGLDRDDMLPHELDTPPHDDDLHNAIWAAIRAADFIIDEDQLDLFVLDDVVTLRGEVASLDQLNQLLQLVEQVPGVGEVMDEVYISGH